MEPPPRKRSRLEGGGHAKTATATESAPTSDGFVSVSFIVDDDDNYTAQPTMAPQISVPDQLPSSSLRPPEPRHDGPVEQFSTADMASLTMPAHTLSPIPDDILELRDKIRALPTSDAGIPLRKHLKAMREHFAATGTLKKGSPLRSFVGDERLFTKVEWDYLLRMGQY